MIVCFSYTKLNLNVISLILSILITCVFNNIFFSLDKFKLNAQVEGYYNDTKDIKTISYSKNETTKEVIDSDIWEIEIPKINLQAKIADGTTDNILNQFVGHFNETPRENGNVALAAHNRGYSVNYFERLKELEIGDEIIYTYKKTKRKYTVVLKSIIKDTEWKNLENTEENRITLITCVENEPEYRRCIQGIEIIN